MKRRLQMLAGAGLTALALSAAWAADAQTAPADAGAPPPSTTTAIGEVVVTATKTGATSLQKTAIAVDVVSGSDLSKDNIKNIKDLTQEAPSLTVTLNNVNPQIYVRGVGGFQGGESDVSMYLDGVYLSRVSVVLQTDFNDLDRIEVIEGPQGTLFGRNATGGAINFISRAPTDTFHFQDTFNTGNYNLIDEAATISGPLAPNLQGSLSFSHVQHDGYLKNIAPNATDIDAANRTGVRVQLRWEPTADIVNTVRGDYIYTNENWQTNDNLIYPVSYSHLADTIIGNFREVDVNSIPHNNELAYGLSDDFNWKINDHLSLKSLTAGRTDVSYNFQDGDVTEITAQYGYTHYAEYQVSQEFNLINNYGPLNGVVGLYYFDEHVRQIGNTYLPGGNAKTPNPANGMQVYQDTLQPTISKAVFFEETYHIIPTLGFTVGARYTMEHKTLNTFNTNYVYDPGAANNGSIPPAPPGTVYPFIADLNQDSSAFTPKFALNWQATPDALVYVSATNGYKSGGFSNTARAVLGAAFGPEHIWSYELGAKTDWFDHRLRIDAALFRYDWTGQQFNALIAPTVSVTANAGSSTLNGLDATITAKPMQGLTLVANTTLLNSRYDTFPNYTFPGGLRPFLAGNPNYNVAAGTFNAAGKQLVDAPDVSLNLSGQKDFNLARGADFFIRAEYQYTSKTYYDPTNAPIASRAPFSLVNASIGYSPPGSPWQFGLWGKNLTDTRYSDGFAAPSYIAVPVGDPRTFGVRINYTY